MPSILIQASQLYLDRLHQLDAQSDTSFAKHFPGLGTSDYNTCRQFIAILDRLVPALCEFIAARDNLAIDRLLASSALFYLINPFDIIPDEEGLAGHLDDALSVYRLSSLLEVRSSQIERVLADYRELERTVRQLMPNWLNDAVDGSVQATLQQRTSLVGTH